MNGNKDSMPLLDDDEMLKGLWAACVDPSSNQVKEDDESSDDSDSDSTDDRIMDVKDDHNNFIRPWCEKKLPLLYSFVQIEYWNCGFMRYYTFNNIPNFFLAIPMIIISSWGIISYCKYDWHRIITLGLISRNDKKRNDSSKTYYSSYLLPHIVLWAFLLLYCCTSMHIQVITRFFSSVPTLYWFVAWLIYSHDDAIFKKNNSNNNSKTINWGYIILNYFIFYGILGVVLFTAFYPPA